MARGLALICAAAIAAAVGCGGGGGEETNAAVSCREVSRPEEGLIVLDRVGFIGYPEDGKPAGSEARSNRHGARRFAKLAVQVQGTEPVTISVPPAARGSVDLTGWGEEGRGPSDRERIAAPQDGSCAEWAWTPRPGGILFAGPICLRLRIESEGRSAVVPIGLGRDCPAIGADGT